MRKDVSTKGFTDQRYYLETRSVSEDLSRCSIECSGIRHHIEKIMNDMVKIKIHIRCSQTTDENRYRITHDRFQWFGFFV